ncbi:MAG: hypothetical protein Q4D98_01245 [Planctomycetia bacterium]|nr:hypothetical protein [Planctomycetia bacterium]
MKGAFTTAMLLAGLLVAGLSFDANAQNYVQDGNFYNGGNVQVQNAGNPGTPLPYAAGYNQSWGKTGRSAQDWNRFYHYPYIYYPHNFYPAEYFRSSDNMVRRYPKEMRIPIYDRRNYNYYAEPKPYHQGFHYTVDIF